MRFKLLVFLLSLFSLALAFPVYAQTQDVCSPNITLLNQDPYPAVPGEYVKLVFQVNGISMSKCGDMTVRLVPDYPIILDPTDSGIKKFKKVDYIKDYNTNLVVPFKVRIDENALSDTNSIEVQVQNQDGAITSKKFDLEVRDTKTDFQVFVYDYDYTTSEITFQILNIGDSDIEALTMEVPKQDNILVKGSNIEIVGDLDSNEYTTVDFEARPTDGKIQVNLYYSDEINVRRKIVEEVVFDSSYFQERFSVKKSTSGWAYAFWILVLVWVILFFLRRRKKKKEKSE
ncbi:MAG: hypothetical protein WC494_04250 [Candidatus Pacearchaeota archaeon]